MDPFDPPGIISTLLCRDLTKLSLDLETLIRKLPEIAMAPTAKSLEPQSPEALSADIIPTIPQTLLCRDLTKLSLDMETLIWIPPEIAMAPTAKSMEPRSPIAMSADSR